MTGSGSQPWQEQAWDYVEKVGELGYYVGWRSSAASRCRLVASEVDPETRQPTGLCQDQQVVQIVADIGGDTATQAGLLARMTGLLTVPGEGFYAVLVRDPERELTPDRTPPIPGVNGMPEAGTEQWFAFSREEIARRAGSSDQLDLTLPDGTVHSFDPNVDILFRVWQPDLKKATQATSPVKGVLPALNEITRSTITIDNASMSRLVGNGVLFVPQEMSLPVNTGVPTAEALANGTPAVPPAQFAAAGAQQLQDLLYEVGTTAYADQNSMAAFLPIIAASPGEWIKNVTHIRFDSAIPETAIKTRDSAMQRLARGLDVSPERLLGLGDTNHWSAWSLDEQDVKVHIAPAVEVICAALTVNVFRDALVAAGKDPSKFVIWYDAAEITQDPDKSDEAQAAFEAGQLRGEAYRRYLGLSEDDGYDLTTTAGWEELARDRAASDVNLIPMLAPLLDQSVADITAPAIAAPNPSPAGEVIDANPEEPDTEHQDPAAASAQVVQMCVNRALELAAKRRMTRAGRDRFSGVPLHQVHRDMPPVESREKALRLIAGWDDPVTEDDVVGFGITLPQLRTRVTAAAVSVLMGEG